MKKVCLKTEKPKRFEIVFQKDFIVNDYIAMCSCCNMEESRKDFLDFHLVDPQQEMNFNQKNLQLTC
jgi:hypothetical protein